MLIEEFLVFAGLMATLGCITKIILTILNRRRAVGDGSATTLNEISQRLGRLEQAVDATAIEVERVAEGQRFTTKLLAERGAGHQAVGNDPGRGRVVTPH